MLKGITYALLSVLTVASRSQAQPRVEWTQIPTTAAPSYAPAGALSCDEIRRDCIYFGGWNYWHRYGAETWRWTGLDWQPVGPPHSPSGRTALASAYDGARGQIVLYGGYDNSFRQIGDTWIWTGSDWQQRTPANSPGTRDYHAMAFDAARSQVMLFGGRSSDFVDTNETWVWEGYNWRKLSPASSPGRRWGHGMAYDAARSQVVVFGGARWGQGSSGEVLNDTWIWDGTTWTQVHPSHTPSGRALFGMAYDEKLGGVVLYGGIAWEAGSGTPRPRPTDTWLWDGLDWRLLQPQHSPLGRQGASVAYDRASRSLILYGGFTGPEGNSTAMDHQTWKLELIDNTPPVITPTITGPKGSNDWYTGPVTVSWTVTDPESPIVSTTGCETRILTVDTPGVPITCSATNGVGLTASGSVEVKIDQSAPTISGMPAAGCTLWPPNKQMVRVATVTAEDARSGIAQGALQVRATSNEPSDPKSPDIVITPNQSGGYFVDLRADRLGNGTGRIYSIFAAASDLAGNSRTVTATCSVTHDQGNGK